MLFEAIDEYVYQKYGMTLSRDKTAFWLVIFWIGVTIFLGTMVVFAVVDILSGSSAESSMYIIFSAVLLWPVLTLFVSLYVNEAPVSHDRRKTLDRRHKADQAD